jgi:DNA invertase Pin-like site-specific DNA recombinase
MSNCTITQPQRVVLYVRVATEEHDRSAEAQEATLRDYAQRGGWDCSTVIREVRPHRVSSDVLGILRDADVVVVTRLDRLARTLVDLVEIRDVLRDAGVKLMTASEDPPNPVAHNGPLDVMASIQAVLEDHARVLHSERTRRGIAAAKARREARR